MIDAAPFRKFVAVAQRDLRRRPRQLARPVRRAALVGEFPVAIQVAAVAALGIEVGTRVNIPDALIPADARVEMDAKMAAGYFTPGVVPDAAELAKAKGRGFGAS